MLTLLRQFVRSWVAAVFLGVLALSFVVWGVQNPFAATAGNNRLVQDSHLLMPAHKA